MSPRGGHRPGSVQQQAVAATCSRSARPADQVLVLLLVHRSRDGGGNRRDRYPASAAAGGERALAGLSIRPEVVLLDGNYDWLTRPSACIPPPRDSVEPGQVTLKVKGDMTCASVAAASVIAKVERDALMVELAASYPLYGWQSNKGYAAPEHRAAPWR